MNIYLVDVAKQHGKSYKSNIHVHQHKNFNPQKLQALYNVLIHGDI